MPLALEIVGIVVGVLSFAPGLVALYIDRLRRHGEVAASGRREAVARAETTARDGRVEALTKVEELGREVAEARRGEAEARQAEAETRRLVDEARQGKAEARRCEGVALVDKEKAIQRESATTAGLADVLLESEKVKKELARTKGKLEELEKKQTFFFF